MAIPTKLQVANLVFDSGETTRISSLTGNIVSIWANSTNVLHISPTITAIQGALTVNNTINIETGNLTANGLTQANLSISLPANLANIIHLTDNNTGVINTGTINVSTESKLSIGGISTASRGTWTRINTINITANTTNIHSPLLSGWNAIRVMLSNISTHGVSVDPRFRFSEDATNWIVSATYNTHMYNSRDILSSANGIGIRLMSSGSGTMQLEWGLDALNRGALDGEYLITNWDSSSNDMIMITGTTAIGNLQGHIYGNEISGILSETNKKVSYIQLIMGTGANVNCYAGQVIFSGIKY